jgi:hypothetical protein
MTGMSQPAREMELNEDSQRQVWWQRFTLHVTMTRDIAV